LSFAAGYSKLKLYNFLFFMGVCRVILITGAAGKTGLAVLKALLRSDSAVRALVRRSEQAAVLQEIGAADTLIGDMTDTESIKRAMKGIKAVYHICPNMHPAETEIGRMTIDVARQCGVEHFVYHSVLHPQTEKMPHHWQKLLVEEMLFESALDFTILQPAPYMQNILAARASIITEGFYRVPYPVNTCLSLVDLEDLAEAVAVIFNDSGHKRAVYEIVGTAGQTQSEVATIIGSTLKRSVIAEEIPADSWQRQAQEAGMHSYQVETLVKMFHYYALFGLQGNSNVLRLLIGREPHSLHDFLQREFIDYLPTSPI
jgi:uncharacterized protein YbjT (DUF2867 family)